MTGIVFLSHSRTLIREDLTPKIVYINDTAHACFTGIQYKQLVIDQTNRKACDSLLNNTHSQIFSQEQILDNNEKIIDEQGEQIDGYIQIIKKDSEAIKLKDKENKQLRKHLRKRNIIDIILVGLLIIAVL